MAEEQRVAVLEVGLNRLRVERALHVVRREDHDQVGLGGSLGRSDDPQAFRLGLGAALAALRQPDADVDPGVAQRERVGVPLAAVAEHGHVLALDQGQVGVVVVEHVSHWKAPSFGFVDPYVDVVAPRRSQALAPQPP